MDNVQLATAVSIVTTAISVIAMQCKKMAYVRALQFVANFLLVVQYAITDNLSASGVCIMAIGQVIVAIIFQRLKKPFPIPLVIFFMAAYITITVISFEKAPDILTGVAACLFALSVVQTKNENYRVCSTLNCTTWLIFDIWSGTYTAVILHATLFVIDVTTIIRLDGKMWLGKIRSHAKK